MFRRALVAALALALSGCATPFRETPALCRATVDVARVQGADEGAQVSFVERDGIVSCSAEGAGHQICAAYAAEPPGAGLAPIGEAFRSCLYGHGYIRRAERGEVRGQRMITDMRGGFRFEVTLHLELSEDGTRYQLELEERIYLTEARAARGA
jgi:hypothetical protein